MSSIDERVVEMQFRNDQFEQGVKKSLISLENLKKGLNLDKSSKSLSNLVLRSMKRRLMQYRLFLPILRVKEPVLIR